MTFEELKQLAQSFGFADCGVVSLENNQGLVQAGEKLNQWLAQGFHGSMGYMAKHGDMRFKPEKLLPEARSILVCRMDYLCENPAWDVLNNPDLAFISRYAQNRDYHKLIRARLVKFAEQLKIFLKKEFAYRPTADSAPIMEKPLAQEAGLGWIGKHTNLINPQNGSYFFLGCLIVSLDLADFIFPQKREFRLSHEWERSRTLSEGEGKEREGQKQENKSHCGSCTRCITICPTQAIIAPYQLDARRCISYLTIENHGPIPMEFRKAIGNRIYGCDDCQMICPWNKFAKPTQELGFESLRNLKAPKLLDLFKWTEAEFLKNTEGSPIRRIGYQSWMRNIAVALGNSTKTPEVLKILNQKLLDPNLSDMVKEHVGWALEA